MSANGPRPGMGRAWLGYLAAGAGAIVGYYLIPAAGAGIPGRVAVYCLISASAAVAVCTGVLVHRPRPALPWLLLGASQVVYAAADSTFYISHYLLGRTGFPSWADPLYLGHYPLVVLAMVLLIRRRSPGRDVPSVLDASVLAVVAAMLSWLYLIAPQTRTGAPMLVTVTSVAYPVMDLVMLAAALRLILGGGRRSPSFVLLAGYLLAIFTADTVYVLQQLTGSYHAGNFLDAIWLSGNLALGAAALHPTMTRLGEPSAVSERMLGRVRIVALCVAALVAPATLLIQYATGAPHAVPVIAAACAVLFVLTILRLHGLVVDQRRLAITDGLTGLYTRRFFEAQLPLEAERARRSGGSMAVVIADVDRFKSINDRYGHPAGDRALIEIAHRLRRVSRSGEVLARYGGEEFALLVPEASPNDLPGIAQRLRDSVASSPMAVTDTEWIAVTVSVGAACHPQHGSDPDKLVAAADRALYSAKSAGADRVVVGTPAADNGGDPALVDYLCRIADQVDVCLSSYKHSLAISQWAGVLAVALGLDEPTVRRTALAGRLHDIGKIVIPEAVLTKTSPLSDEEWRLMREHADYGYRLARTVPGFSSVAQVIRQHHERYDGTGYPQGLLAQEIRPEARVIAVCDAWAAMQADRPHQVQRTLQEARLELRRGRGTQFDPDVVDLFLDLQQRGRVGDLDRAHANP
ncbi:MAG TPA: diguanylate cyclase [Actinophytocola sp.]|uniref:bifunctional diguanylate cyclase/phosphohydrolase n=1 Tax=Actinophytocola sp. TaxID=1872138 RepID=UPI002DB8FFEA|nr:diguanylate cyclase [Actinophytocola sp.]HEU5473461.1 diguanylate cyclase [Actinophytocola sp.]